MTTPLPQLENKRAFVRAMFDRIAPRYDLVNRLMTLGLDQSWRRSALEAASVGPGDRVLDLACGTGDLSELCERRGATVIGLDLAREMLRAANHRNPVIGFCQCDASALPVADASVTVVTCGFALRNFTNLEQVFREAARVLVPGGRLILLEIDQPESRLLRMGHGFHMNQIVPRLGSLISDAEAYRYLPASFEYLPGTHELAALLHKSGFARSEKRAHLFGAAQRVLAWRAE